MKGKRGGHVALSIPDSEFNFSIVSMSRTMSGVSGSAVASLSAVDFRKTHSFGRSCRDNEMNDKRPTDATVAAWMVEQLRGRRHLYQEQVAWEIRRLFGKSFVYNNENGNPAISKSILE